jgi:ABC-type multidrug transport system fused ATPase/permease subunit
MLAKKQAKANKATFEATDKEFEAFSSVIDSQYNTEKIDVEKEIKQKFIDSNKDFIKSKDVHSMSNSSVENLYFVFYNLIIYVLTILMILFLSRGEMNLTLYLIVIPYLSSGTEACNSLFAYITQINYVNVAMNRIEILLKLKTD